MVLTNYGLEDRSKSGEWVGTPPVENSFVVNIGDILQYWAKVIIHQLNTVLSIKAAWIGIQFRTLLTRVPKLLSLHWMAAFPLVAFKSCTRTSPTSVQEPSSQSTILAGIAESIKFN